MTDTSKWNLILSTVLFGLGTALIAIGCRKPEAVSAVAVRVEVSRDAQGKVSVSPDPVHLSVERQEFADWHLAAGQDFGFSIAMKDSDQPAEKRLPTPSCNANRKHCRSAVPETRHYGKHAYEVVVTTAQGTTKTEPEVIVEK